MSAYVEAEEQELVDQQAAQAIDGKGAAVIGLVALVVFFGLLILVVTLWPGFIGGLLVIGAIVGAIVLVLAGVGFWGR